VAPALNAKDLEGVDIFGSDGQQIGKVAKVNEANGKVTGAEVKSPGMFSFFAKTYVVPVEKLNKKNGRVELTMTSDEAKQLAK
jgi:sporulation protein YlmC with PRC-barrel domain